MENALLIVDQAEPPAELAATLELAADFARASKAKTTLAAYASDWRVFESWQMKQLGGVVPVRLVDVWPPSATSTVLPGLETPTGDEKVEAVLSGIGRTIGAAPVPKKAATNDIVLGMVGGKGTSLRELRDRASSCSASLVPSAGPSSWR